jgi:hypothetical protein
MQRSNALGSEVLELWVAFKTAAVQWLKSHRFAWLIRDTGKPLPNAYVQSKSSTN